MKCLFLVLALCAAFVTQAAADDLIVSRAVLEDVAGTLSIAEVAGREFTPVGPTLSKGYTRSVHWLRLQVRAPAKGSEVVLFIRQPFLNEIRLYQHDSGDPRDWSTRATGNHYAYDTRDRAKSSLGFVVNATAPITTYYLRLKTSTVSQLSVQALEPAEALRKDHQFDLLELFFVTSMLLLLLWALHSYFLDRLPVVGLFALHQAAYTLYGVAITGYLAPFIPVGFPELADLSSAIPYCAVSFTTLLFCRELFKPYQPAPLLMRGLSLLLWAFPLQLAAIALGHTPWAAILNFVLLRVSWWYFVVIVFTLRKEYSPSRRLLQLFFVVITVLFSLFWYSSRSSATGTNGNLYGRQVLIANGLIIGALFAMILNARSRRLLQEAQRSALQLQAKSEFLALVSHEIRTPLNALVGFSTMARATKDPLKLDQYHVILEQSSRSLMELVNGLLDLSKVEAGRMEYEALPLDLRQLIGSLEAEYRPPAERKRVAFRVEVADDVPAWVLGDPVRLRQILGNLLSNAVKFTESGSVSCFVSLAARPVDRDAPLVRFEVQDTGIGIPLLSRHKLFHPFSQMDCSISRRFGGTGLGLAIVRSLVALLKGNISFESREGAGSSFVVELPLRETEPLPETAAPALELASRAVLVVEDNGFNRRLLGDILASWGQLATLAEDGRQALQLMDGERFDLVLLDIRMPGIDGIELCRRIRARERELSLARVPIIAISADVDAATRAASLAAGIDAVLAKPVIPEQLARAIAEHAGASPADTPGAAWRLSPRTSSDLGNNPERARQYREMLLQDIDLELQTLQGAHARDDRGDLGQAAHTLRGLCGHLASREPAELATWLQLNAPSARPEQLQRVIGELVRSMKGEGFFQVAQEDYP